MKKLKKQIFIFLVLISFFSFNTRVNAASISIKASSQTVVKGTKISITPTVTATSPIASIEGTVTCSGAGVAANAGTNLNFDDSSNSLYAKSFSFEIKPTTTGTITCKVNPGTRITEMANDGWQDLPQNSITINVIEPTKVTPKEYDANNNLKSLTVDGQNIEPAFNKDTTEYKLSLDQSVEKINIQASAESDKASVSGTGEKTLSQGENTIEVKVTAENGNEKIYKIIVTVEDKHPISTKVGKNTYTVVKKNNNLIDKLENYEEVTIKIDDQDVVAYKNNKTDVLLVILKDKDNKLAYYTYNEQTKKYEEYHYIKVGNITLQILPSTTPEKYLKDTLKIQNQTIDYYKISKKNKIGLIYGTNIKTGNTGYYVYDTEEETLSRYYNPEVKLYQKELKQLKEYTMIVIGVIALLSIIVIICSLKKGKKKQHLKTM